MRLGMVMWFKVAAAKEPKPLPEMFRPGGFNTLANCSATWWELAGIHLQRWPRSAWRRFSASVRSSRLRLRGLLRHRPRPVRGDAGENGVLVLPAATSAAPFQNQDLLFLDSPGMTALFTFKVPVTVCP
ncbi:hypothetical protein HPB49_026525 [Dermacentor silvarum]|nr:hypothetical protein HPB49_026525 [Dermacentor silvarum]